MPVKVSNYILTVLILFSLNIFTVNLVAWRDREIGKLVLPDKIRSILFPFLYVKRFSKMALLCQIFNCIIFTGISLMLYVLSKNPERIFQKYCIFERNYMICVLLYSEGRRTFINLYHMCKQGKNQVIDILYKKGGELYHIGENEVTVLKPEVVKGSIFIISGGLNHYLSEIDNEAEIKIESPVTLKGYINIMMEKSKDNISEVYYGEILQRLFDEKQMLICIKKYPVEGPENYAVIMKRVCTLFDLHNIPTCLLGCGIESMLELFMTYCTSEIKGMILIDKLSERKLKEKLEPCVEDDFFHRVIVDKQKACMINIYEKNTEEKLLNWIKEKYRQEV